VPVFVHWTFIIVISRVVNSIISREREGEGATGFGDDTDS
jgi:hypothetical protein